MYRIIVDAHVHIHDSFSLPTFFEAAVDNFREASKFAAGTYDHQYFILLLSESPGTNYYGKLMGFAENNQTISCQNGMGWNCKPTFEDGALRICRSEKECLFLLAGRQLVTYEKLEVLALMTPSEFEEKQPFSRTIQSVRRAGGIPVVPWGFLRRGIRQS